MSLKILPLIRKATWTMIKSHCLLTSPRPHQTLRNKGNGTEKREKLTLVTWIQMIRFIKFQASLKAFESGLMTPNLYVDWTLFLSKMEPKRIAEWLGLELKTKQHFSCSPMINSGTLMVVLLIKGIWDSSYLFQQWILAWNSELRRGLTNSIAELSKANPSREFLVQ